MSTPARPASAPPSNNLLGIALAILGVLCFSGMDASAKWLNQSISPFQTVSARYIGSFLFVLPLINPWTIPGVLRTRRLGLQCARALCLLVATLGSFTALRYLPLTLVTSITFASPLLVAILAGPLLGERIGPRRAVAVIVGFAGVLVVTRPFNGHLHPAALLAVGNAAACAIYYVLTRKLAAHDRPETTMFYTGFVGALGCVPLVPFTWQTPSTAGVWIVMIVLGGMGALAHWLLILAHRHSAASVLAPFFYAQILGAAFLGWLVFREVPDRWTLLGIAIVVASGLYLVYRERVRQKYPSSDVTG